MLGSSVDRQLAAELEVYAAEFEQLHQQESPRLQRYERLRKDSDRLRDRIGRGSPTDEYYDYGKRKKDSEDLQRHTIPLPLADALKIKHTYRIAGRLPEFIVDERAESPQERYRAEVMQKMWYAILGQSNGDSQFSDGAQDGSDVGTTCFDIYFDFALQMPRFRSIAPDGILVIPGHDDPHDFERVYRFWEEPVVTVRARYADKQFRGSQINVNRISGKKKDDNREYITIVSMCSRDRKLKFALGSNTPLEEYVHNLGFAPYVAIPNIGLYRDVYGWADREMIRDLVAYIESEFGAEADIIRNVANGAYLEKGTGLSPTALKKVLREGGVANSKREGTVDPIQPPDVPNFVPQHHQLALTFLKMLSFTPDAGWGLSAAGSGSAKQVDLQPQLELTSMKQANWSRGLARLGSYAYRMTERQQAATASYRGALPNRLGVPVPFRPFDIGPGLDPMEIAAEHGPVMVPRNAVELFGGDYTMRVVFSNRIDPDDPSFILAEINRFRQGIQSLETTLERLGVNNPRDEMRRMEDEADRFPWLNNGLIALLRAQIAAQGGSSGQGAGGGGSDGMPWGDATGALGMTQTKDGPALNADALGSLLGGTPGQAFGGA